MTGDSVRWNNVLIDINKTKAELLTFDATVTCLAAVLNILYSSIVRIKPKVAVLY